MAQKFVTTSGTLIVPGAYAEVTVARQNAGVSTTGVLMIFGEADAGPDFSLEDDLKENGFGPNQMAAVLAKYGSGPLVDAYAAAVAPANDPEIQGAPSRLYLIKTNVSTKAEAALVRNGLDNYGEIRDISYGDLGNGLYFDIADETEAAYPETGSITWIPTPSGASVGIRVNGGALQTLAITALDSPAETVGSVAASSTGLSSLSGILPTGGVDRLAVAGLSGTLAVAATGNNIVITLGTDPSWATMPVVGDTLCIPGANGDYGATAGSVISGGSDENAGAYVVTAVTATTISATKLRNNASGALVAPTTVAAQAISGTPANELKCFSPINIKNVTGTDRGLLAAGNVGVNLTGTYANSQLTITLASGSWDATPKAGDYVFVADTANNTIANAAGGWHEVVSATSSTMVLSRLSTDRASTAFGATAIGATTDILCIRPDIDGLAKSLEIQDNAGTDSITTILYTTAGVAVDWISSSGSPNVIESADERQIEVRVFRNSDGVNESFTAGGDVLLRVGYQGTTATLTVGENSITSSVTGGSGANMNISFSTIRTISDLVARINALTGYKAELGSALFGQYPVTALDRGTYAIASTQSTVVTGIKADAYDFFNELTANSSHVQLDDGEEPAAQGLPEVQATTFLAGGARGATTAAKVIAAIDACEKLKGNFLVSCFSRDASDDITDSITDSASTYEIDAINAYMNTHVIKMSQLKRGRPRQGFASKQTTFVGAKFAASNLASARMAMAFQDFKAVSSGGTIVQFPPWYNAALAAGMQAAGFYKGIFNKGLNCSGVVQAAGDYDDADQTEVEEALESGLLPAQARDTGGFSYVSDQTTYSFDENFVYNSIQAVYVGDVIAQTIAQRLQRAFVGQSFADISAALVLSFLKGIVADLRRLKLVAISDAVPEGFANAIVRINGPAMEVSLDIVAAGLLYFIPIKLQIQQVQQTAST